MTKIEAVYSFGGQVKAMFMRRYYNTIRNRTNIIQIILPFIYVVTVTGMLSTSSILQDDKTMEVLQVILFSTLSLIGFLINTTMYNASIVWERENKVKYFLRTTGLRHIPYWLGTALFDMMIMGGYAVLIVPIGYFL